MPVEPGTKIGPYEVVSPLGAGGMGEVFRARDTKLNRDVAIKVLPDVVVEDPERRARFQREAEVLASLNHPNIGAIYGLEEGSHTFALVLELVEGETLAERIVRGPVAVEEALRIAAKMAEALEEAHERGIVHRDLKPANIKIDEDGKIKVLDFGLAKALVEEAAPADSSMSPTITRDATRGGVILGTAAYMSPEQARGKRVDARTDVWAFGVVLYEMLTGKRPFSGEDVSEILASVIKAEPDWRALPADTPGRVRELLRRCLTKDKRRRLGAMSEALYVLEKDSDASPAHEAKPVSWHVTLGVAVVAILATTALVTWLDEEAPGPTRKFPLPVEGLSLANFGAPKLSPDATQLVYLAHDSLWIRELDRHQPRRLEGTEGARVPFWSPDGDQIAFLREGRLWRVPASGGEATVLAALPGKTLCGAPGGVWRPNGTLLVSTSCNADPLLAVFERGGDFEEVLHADGVAESDFHELSLLPDERGVLLAVHRATASDTLAVWDGSARKTILQLEGEMLQSPIYSPTGHVLYHRRTTNPGIWAVPFSLTSLTTDGEPFLVAPDMHHPSVAGDGTLVYVPMSETGDSRLAWVDRNGSILEAVSDPHPGFTDPSLSEDGTRAAVSRRDERGNRGIWTFELDQNRQRRITFEEPDATWPVWSGNRQLFFNVFRASEFHLYHYDRETGSSRLLHGRGGWAAPAPDGDTVVFTTHAGYDLWVLDLAGSEEPRALLEAPGRQIQADFARDGLLAYASDETGQMEIWGTTFPGAGRKWQISQDGGVRPKFSPDGETLYFTAGNVLFEVDVDREPSIGFGQPRRLFSGAENETWPAFSGFDVGRDGERFLMVERLRSLDSVPTLTIVENWYSEFQEER